VLQKKKAHYSSGKRRHNLIYNWSDVQKGHKNETVPEGSSPKTLYACDVSKDEASTPKTAGSTKNTCLENEESSTTDSWQDTELSERLSTVESDLSHSLKFGTPSSRNSSQLSLYRVTYKYLLTRKEQKYCHRGSTYTDHHSPPSRHRHRAMVSRQGGSSTTSTRSSATTSRAKSRTFPAHNNFTANSCLQAHSIYPGASNYITSPFTFSYFKNYSN